MLRLIDAGFRTTQMMYFLFENCASHATAVAALTRRILDEAGVSEEDSEGCQRFLQVLYLKVSCLFLFYMYAPVFLPLNFSFIYITPSFRS